MPEYMMTKDGQLIPLPNQETAEAEVPEPTPVSYMPPPEPAKPKSKNAAWRKWMFETPKAEDNDINTDDLFDLDTDRDIVDVNEDGNLDDLFEVTEEDIMGDELGRTPGRYIPKRERAARRARTRRYPPETGMIGQRY